MKLKTKLLGALGFAFLGMASTANAADCSWNLTGINVNPHKFIFSCAAGNTLAATKTVTVTATSAPTCSLNLQPGYSNVGSCNSPNVIVTPPNYFPITINNTSDNSPYCSSSYTSPSDPNIWRKWTISCPNTPSVKIDLITPPGAGVCYPQVQTSGYSVSGHCSGFTVSKN